MAAFHIPFPEAVCLMAMSAPTGCAGALRADVATLAPASAKTFTTAAPRPAVPPVTTTRRPSRCRSKLMP